MATGLEYESKVDSCDAAYSVGLTHRNKTQNLKKTSSSLVWHGFFTPITIGPYAVLVKSLCTPVLHGTSRGVRSIFFF